VLAGNRLSDLPSSLAELTALELVRLSSNRFETFPPWLARLPKLAWISWSGNPVERDLAPAVAEPVSWADLDIGDRLGGGASGDVHRATWRSDNLNEPFSVAVKLFRGSMTSDGSPDTEIAGGGATPQSYGGAGEPVGSPGAKRGAIDAALAGPLAPARGTSKSLDM
jgi:hypothetical protein